MHHHRHSLGCRHAGGLLFSCFRGFCAVLLGLLLAACSPSEPRIVSGDHDGILHFGNGTEPQGLDPHVVTGIPEHHIIIALFEGLVTKNPWTLAPEPGVAQSWEISPDGRVYTFHLNPEARWSNGEGMTAEDWVWSWARALNPRLGSEYSYMYYPIVNAQAFAEGKITDFSQVGVKALDGYTLQVTLNNPTPYFLQLLDHYSMFPVHRATVEKFGEPWERYTRWTHPGNLVGNGPFQLEEWVINRVVKVKRNPHYRDAHSIKLNGIHFYPTENQTTEERMFRAGQLHRTEDVPVDKVVAYRERGDQRLVTYPYLGTYFYRINTSQPQFRDARVRRALAMALDREMITRQLLKGMNQPAYAVTPPDTMGYFPPQRFGYDPEQARRLLAEAGYPDGKGFPPTELIYNTHEMHRKIAVAVQQMWKKNLNIDITLANQDWKVYLDNEITGNFYISRASWIGDYVDPYSFLDMWTTGNGNNRTGWSSAEYDRIIQREAPGEIDREKRYALYREAESIMMDAMPIIPVYTYASKHLIQPSVRGMPPNIMDHINFRYVSLQHAATGEAN